MARNVRDLALMLDAGVGHEPEDPFSFEHPGRSFTDALEGTVRLGRVAFSPDLGIVPMSREIAEVSRAGAERFRDLGAEITGDIPDFSGALDGFQTLRAVLLGTMMAPLLETHRDQIAPEIIGNIERGFSLTPEQVFRAERDRWHLYQRMTAFFKTHDLLVCPSASIPPFPVEQRYVEEIDGQACETYIDWFSITFALTMTSCPVLSMPCGFTGDGLPVGIQIVGRPRGEAALLGFAHQLEQVLGIATELPIDPRTPVEPA